MKSKDKPNGIKFVQVGATIPQYLKDELKKEAKDRRNMYSTYIEDILRGVIIRPSDPKL